MADIVMENKLNYQIRDSRTGAFERLRVSRMADRSGKNPWRILEEREK
jgi:hypothetical protein